MDDALAPPIAPAAARPTWEFMLSHPAHSIALGFGSGLSPVAPGTAGTLFAWIVYVFIADWFTPFTMGVFIGACALVGWWACTFTAARMRVLDPGSIVWDEVVAFWVVLWLVMPTGFVGQLAAFAIFRVLDTAKPGPIGWADALFHGFGWRGGLGIMLDDLVGAFCTLFLVAAWRFYQ